MSFFFGVVFGIFASIALIVASIIYLFEILGKPTGNGPRNDYAMHSVGNKQEERNSLDFKPMKDGPSSVIRRTWVKILFKNEEPKKDPLPSVFLVLKANMLFQFSNEQADICKGVCCLDNCIVDSELKKLKKNIPVWKPSNGLILSSPTRDLFPGNSTIILYFRTGKDLEEWYYALKRASSLTKEFTVEQKRQEEYWTNLSERLINTETQCNPDWLTAIASRLFYHLYNSENLINLVLKKIRKKLQEIEKPYYISDISILDIYLGPNLPIIKSIKLISVSNEGAVEACGDILYLGGFKSTAQVTFKITLPGNRTIFIPATLTANIQKLEGKVHFHCDAPPASCFWLGFYGEPQLDIKFDTEIGENYKIRSIPTLTGLITSKVKQGIIENMLLPNMIDVPIPDIPNPLKGFKGVLKKTESEPVLNFRTQSIAFSESTPPSTHKQILENIDKQIDQLIESETNKKNK